MSLVGLLRQEGLGALVDNLKTSCLDVKRKIIEG